MGAVKEIDNEMRFTSVTIIFFSTEWNTLIFQYARADTQLRFRGWPRTFAPDRARISEN